MRVLVVDGYPDAAESCALLLEQHGFQTAVASSGEGALAAVEDFTPHVILMEIGLGDLDGRDVCRRIRSMPLGQRVKILVVSGWTQPAVKASALAAGCDRYLLKPAAVDELIAAIAKVHRDAGAAPRTRSMAVPSASGAA